MNDTPRERLNSVLALINTWWPPLIADDCLTATALDETENRLGALLPMALREWYMLVGHRREFIGNQDYLLTIEELTVDDDLLLFCIENQAVVSWGIRRSDLVQADPPVIVFDDRTMPTQHETERTFSQFMLMMVAYATVTEANFTAKGKLTSEQIRVLKHHYPDVLLPSSTFSSWHSTPNSLLWLYTEDDETSAYLRFGARTRLGMEQFLTIVGREWGEVHHESQSWEHTYHTHCTDVPPSYIVREPLYHLQDVPGDFPACHHTSPQILMEVYGG